VTLIAALHLVGRGSPTLRRTGSCPANETPLRLCLPTLPWRRLHGCSHSASNRLREQMSSMKARAKRLAFGESSAHQPPNMRHPPILRAIGWRSFEASENGRPDKK